MNRDISDIRREYVDLIKKAMDMRVAINYLEEWHDYISIVRSAYHRRNYIKRILPEWQCPYETDLQNMCNDITAKLSGK